MVADTSVVNMLQESLTSPAGCLFPYRNITSGETDFEGLWAALLLYWTAVRDTFPDAWGKPPTRSRFMHGAGIRAMGRLMDRILAAVNPRHPNAADQVQADLARIAPHCRWTRGTWEGWDCAGTRSRTSPSTSMSCPTTWSAPISPRRTDEVLLPGQPGPDRPGFDFVSEEHAPHRIRQRDDLYAHEVLSQAPFDGILVSKAIVDGKPNAAGKYTLAQRNRLYREGVRQFFRLDATAGPRLATMGDCGAFSYISEEVPPYSPDEVIDFYAECGFDLGVSVDHVILVAGDERTGELGDRWQERQQVTLELAAKFRASSQARRVRFEPVGVAQGWSPRSYLVAVAALQQMGYQRIALGGMVPLKTKEILQSLRDRRGPPAGNPLAPAWDHPLRQPCMRSLPTG